MTLNLSRWSKDFGKISWKSNIFKEIKMGDQIGCCILWGNPNFVCHKRALP